MKVIIITLLTVLLCGKALQAQTVQQTKDSLALPERGRSLQGARVVARRPVSEEFAVQKMDQLDIYQNPTANADPLKAIAMLPASTTTDESANPSLRGSSADRTRVVLNGVPVYNPAKFGGLDNIGSFSIFNVNLVQHEYVYAGNPPLSYGNATAGLVEIETTNYLNQNSTECSVALGNAGIMRSQRLKSSENFVQFYGNVQYGAPVIALNGKSIPRLNSYSTLDGGLNLHLKLGENVSLNLYSYIIKEKSNYRPSIFTYEADALKEKTRNFNVLSFKWQKGRHLISLHHGSDFSKEQLQFGNMNYTPRNMQFYNAAGYKYLWNKVTLQAGASYEYTRYALNGSRLPQYYYALAPQSPSFISDSPIRSQNLEAYLYTKWEISKKWILSGGLRAGLPLEGGPAYLSAQAALKYDPSKQHSFLLSAGKYHGRSVPNYYQMVYSPQSAAQLMFDYTWQKNRTAIQAALYYKIEKGAATTNYIDRSNHREIFGAEFSVSQTFYKVLKLSGAYTYLHSTQYMDQYQFPSYNSMPYIFKATVSYQKLSVGTFALSYVSRPGLWFTPVTDGVYNPMANSYAPVYSAGINSERMGAYNRVDFTANKVLFIGKCSIINFLAINNIFNIQNNRERIYSPDYKSYSNDHYQGRLFYFGVMVSF